jgi:chorismate dehydratase
VPSPSKRRLRIAAIDFLNPAPLMWDFNHEPGESHLAERYEIHLTTPSQCATQLASGEADIGLVPIAAYAELPKLKIIPGCAIASLDHVRSILLAVRNPEGIEQVRTVALDTASRTSSAYARILFQKYWNPRTTFMAHEANLDAMLKAADAALLIGDPALLALEDQQAREHRTGEKILYIDLAHEWRARTGVPWVSAFWAVRPDALELADIAAEDVVRDFVTSRDNGVAHVDELVTEWSGKIAVPADTIRTYLTRNIHYVLDRDCTCGLDLFYRYAAECGILPAAPPLRML